MHHEASAGRQRISCRSSLVTLAVAISLIAGVMLATAMPASAAPVWTGTLTPNPTGATTTVLNGLACPTANSCFAVGKYNTISSTKSLVEHWNGSDWGYLATPAPTGSTSAVLNAVSCPSRQSCFAVGNSVIAGVTKGLVEHWNGHDWSVQGSPTPGGSIGTGLSGVDCPSTTTCYAVGSYSTFTTINTVAERWNGSSWSLLTSANPGGSTSSVLNAVDCPTVKSCFAVGNSVVGSVTRGLTEHWNNSSWGLLGSPNPGGATYTTLNGVSCPNSTSCFAVGTSHVGSANRNVSEHWNGHSWGALPTPNPTGTTSTLLNGVSCPSAQSCFAVGYYQGVPVKTLVEHWNGSGWGIMSTKSPGKFFNHFNAVSCANTKTCFAVGNFQTTGTGKSLAERYA